jgi:CheY-like chemotaxis protein/GAF domain-containing protein
LILEGPGGPGTLPLDTRLRDCEVVRTCDLADAVRKLQEQQFDGIFGDPSDARMLAGLVELLQASRIFQTLADGVAVLDRDMRVIWANPVFESWCGGQPRGRILSAALWPDEAQPPNPFPSSFSKTTTLRLACGSRYLELRIAPMAPEPGANLLCLGRDITAETQRQQKLDALHKAGLELAGLSTEHIADMSVEERIELLKSNIRRFTRDLLQYEVVEIRLLDPETGKLEPLLEDGMTQEAAQRVLHARPAGNGVTGYVAAMGVGVLCPDTAADPRYLQGAAGAHSSLTVPLIYQQKVIGTFNVESPKINAFTEEDLQFAEIFCREIAFSLHTLELLNAEMRSAASRSCEAVSREVAMPADDILAASTSLVERYIGHDQELSDKLKKIISGVRTIKQVIQKVGEEMGPRRCMPGEPEPPRPSLKGLRVLVADDDERVRRSAHGLLGRFGCIVDTARDGHEALTMARLSTYDAIIADIRLPDMTGYDFFHKLREAQPQAHVILMTAYGYDPSHSIVKARQEGMKHVLYKPFRVDQLLDALHHANSASPSAKVTAAAK